MVADQDTLRLAGAISGAAKSADISVFVRQLVAEGKLDEEWEATAVNGAMKVLAKRSAVAAEKAVTESSVVDACATLLSALDDVNAIGYGITVRRGEDGKAVPTLIRPGRSRSGGSGGGGKKSVRITHSNGDVKDYDSQKAAALALGVPVNQTGAAAGTPQPPTGSWLRAYCEKHDAKMEIVPV